MTPPYEAVIFDMDGVLADSEPVYNAAMQAVLNPLGIQITEAHQREIMGSSIENTWRYFRETFALEGPLDALVEAYDLHLRRSLAEVHDPLPGVRSVVDALKQRKAPIAVASSSIPEWIAALLGGLGLAEAFDATVSVREAGASKPAPDVYLLAAQRLNTDPARCIAIEDTPHRHRLRPRRRHVRRPDSLSLKRLPAPPRSRPRPPHPRRLPSRALGHETLAHTSLQASRSRAPTTNPP